MMGVDPEGTRLSVLAARAQIAKQTATALVDRLERAGYVERVPDPADGRARLVRLTPRALEAVPVRAGRGGPHRAGVGRAPRPGADGPAPRGTRVAARGHRPLPLRVPGCATLGRVDITARTEYAVRAMLALAQAQELDAGPISVESLAQRQDLPRKFLEAIVADLRAAELVVSTRGARGGYTLARPASDGQSRRRLPGGRRPARRGARAAPARDELRGRGPAPADRVGGRAGRAARGARRHQPRRRARRRPAGRPCAPRPTHRTPGATADLGARMPGRTRRGRGTGSSSGRMDGCTRPVGAPRARRTGRLHRSIRHPERSVLGLAVLTR